MIEEGDIIERHGKRYRVNTESDHLGEPWKEHDGHGPVSEWTRRAKRPGERVLCEDRGSKRYYDAEEATKIAKRDGWDGPPYGGTARQKAHRAVQADYDRLRRWCNGDWCWVGVVVTEICTCDKGHEHDGESASLWGIESDAGGDYLEQVANELIDELQ